MARERRRSERPIARALIVFALAPSALIVAALLALAFQPRWLVGLMARRSPEVVYFVETADPLVALTIDDGPDPRTTPEILRVLSRHGARATFFLIGGRVVGRERLVSEIVKSGHEIGNHMSRDEPSVRLAPADFEAAMLETDAVLSQFARVRWLRPASGRFNERMLGFAAAHDYRIALGSIYPYDGTISSARYSEWLILRSARPGSVIVLHDGGDRGRRTAVVLAKVLPELNRRGFRVVTLSDLAAGSGGRR